MSQFHTSLYRFLFNFQAVQTIVKPNKKNIDELVFENFNNISQAQ